jgi:hypothetical protein
MHSAIYHCHSYIEIFLEMCTTLAFRPFYWLYPGMYQPLQATAILLADLLKSPYSTEAQHSRTLIERLFSLIGSDGIGWYKERSSKRNLSIAGKEVWEMLRRLRRQAWRKAGIDPDIVWMDSNFVQSVGTPGHATTLKPPPHLEMAPVGTSELGSIAPACDNSSAEVASDRNIMSEHFWADNLDLGLGNTDLSGQFTLSDVDGLDWSKWDFLLERYFNMPDPAEVTFEIYQALFKSYPTRHATKSANAPQLD